MTYIRGLISTCIFLSACYAAEDSPPTRSLTHILSEQASGIIPKDFHHKPKILDMDVLSKILERAFPITVDDRTIYKARIAEGGALYVYQARRLGRNNIAELSIPNREIKYIDKQKSKLKDRSIEFAYALVDATNPELPLFNFTITYYNPEVLDRLSGKAKRQVNIRNESVLRSRSLLPGTMTPKELSEHLDEQSDSDASLSISPEPVSRKRSMTIDDEKRTAFIQTPPPARLERKKSEKLIAGMLEKRGRNESSAESSNGAAVLTSPRSSTESPRKRQAPAQEILPSRGRALSSAVQQPSQVPSLMEELKKKLEDKR